MKSKSRLFVAITTCVLCAHLGFGQNNFPSVMEVKGLAIGQEVADFKATDQYGKEFQLSEALLNGSVVLLFYRGQWCPVCNRHLSEIEQGIPQLEARGVTVIAVSPEKPDRLAMTAKKTQASFLLLFDEDYRIAQQFDVLFLPEEKVTSLYNTRLKADLATAHSDDTQRLPVPATFIIGTDSKVDWRHFDPDYNNRASVEEILAALE